MQDRTLSELEEVEQKASVVLAEAVCPRSRQKALSEYETAQAALRAKQIEDERTRSNDRIESEFNSVKMATVF